MAKIFYERYQKMNSVSKDQKRTYLTIKILIEASMAQIDKKIKIMFKQDN